MNVVVDGLMTSYQKIGGGKVILCLPGWGDSSATYTDLAKRLGADYKVLILDLPGFGGSQAPEEAWSLNNFIGFVNHWLKKIGENKLYAIIGHSYGGSLAIKGVADGNLQPEKLVLLASAGIRSKARLRKQLLKGLSKSAKVPLKLLPAKQQRKIRQRFYGAIGSDAILLPHMEQTFKKIIREDIQASAAKINVPTLLVYGRADDSTPVDDGRKLHEAIRKSQLKVLEGGHFIHQDQPDAVGSAIEDFLA